MSDWYYSAAPLADNIIKTLNDSCEIPLCCMRGSDDERREMANELRMHGCCCEGFVDCDECKALSVKLFGNEWVLCHLDSRDVNYWGAIADLIDCPPCGAEVIEREEE